MPINNIAGQRMDEHLRSLERRLAEYRAVKGPHWMVEIARTIIPKLEADIAALTTTKIEKDA